MRICVIGVGAVGGVLVAYPEGEIGASILTHDISKLL